MAADDLALLLDQLDVLLDAALVRMQQAVVTLLAHADWVQFLTALHALKPLLASQNLRALDAHTALRRKFGTPLGSLLNPLEAAMIRLDFKAALAACDVLENKTFS